MKNEGSRRWKLRLCNQGQAQVFAQITEIPFYLSLGNIQGLENRLDVQIIYFKKHNF